MIINSGETFVANPKVLAAVRSAAKELGCCQNFDGITKSEGRWEIGFWGTLGQKERDEITSAAASKLGLRAEEIRLL